MLLQDIAGLADGRADS